MNTEACASLDDLFAALSNEITKEDIIYAKSTAQIVSSLIKERINNNMTQAEFAQKLNVKQSMISRWETGSNNFTVKTLSKIAADLDMDLYIKLVPHRDVQYFVKPSFQTQKTSQNLQYRTTSDDVSSNFRNCILFTKSKQMEVTKW